jgi:hypothetical protein
MSQHFQATLALRAINNSNTKCLGRATLAREPGLAGTMVDTALRYLMAYQLVEHHKRGCYRITALGVAIAATKAGVTKSKTGLADSATQQQIQGASGIRGAAWRALRISPKQAIDEILSRVDDGTTATARSRLTRYLSGLIKAGVIQKKGKHYILVNDLGPLAPTLGQRAQVFDPNAFVFLVGGPK